MERADHLDDAAAALAGAERSLLLAVPDATALGAGAAGRPGELGRALANRLTAVLTARAAEAADTARRLGDTADALRTAARRYADADDAAARRLEREA